MDWHGDLADQETRVAEIDGWLRRVLEPTSDHPARLMMHVWRLADLAVSVIDSFTPT